MEYLSWGSSRAASSMACVYWNAPPSGRAVRSTPIFFIGCRERLPCVRPVPAKTRRGTRPNSRLRPPGDKARGPSVESWSSVRHPLAGFDECHSRTFQHHRYLRGEEIAHAMRLMQCLDFAGYPICDRHGIVDVNYVLLGVHLGFSDPLHIDGFV